MTPRQIELVETSFQRIAAEADKAADIFYERLFAVSPDVRALFSPDLAEQKKKLMQTMEVAVVNIRHLDSVTPALKEMGRRHVGYGVTVPQYALVGGALIWTLNRMLGPDFTPEMRAAWTELYTTLATVMTGN